MVMAPEKFTKALNNIITEDCAEILAYIERENLPNKEDIFEILEDIKAVDAMENIVLQLSRVFGICAFQQDNDLEVFRARVEKSLQNFPIFNIVIRIYQKEINLQDINEGLKDSELFSQEQRLNGFLNSLIKYSGK